MKTNKLTVNETKVLDILPRGIDRPITMTEISKLTELEPRVLYSIIDRLRRHGVPVGGLRSEEKNGYYIATTEAEKMIGASSYASQVNSMSETVANLLASDVSDWEQSISRTLVS